MLLDLKRYSDGHFEATLLGERAESDGSNVVRFESGYDAQQFTSAWYGTPEMRAQMYPKPAEPLAEFKDRVIDPQRASAAAMFDAEVAVIERNKQAIGAHLNRAERRKLRLGKA
jgi:hypothetical protein